MAEYGVAFSDLVLGLVCLVCAKHASVGTRAGLFVSKLFGVSSDISPEVQLISFAFFAIACNAFAGVLRFGMSRRNDLVYQVHGLLTAFSSSVSVPYLFLSQILPLYRSPSPVEVFATLTVLFFATRFLKASVQHTYTQVLQVCLVSALVYLLYTNFIIATNMPLVVAIIFFILAVVARENVTAFHYLFAISMYFFEAGRTNDLFNPMVLPFGRLF